MSKEIIEFIKKRREHNRMERVGVLVGYNDNGTIRIGWAKANTKAGDVFDEYKGLHIARERCFANPANLPYIPSAIHGAYKRFKNRCQRYFKDASLTFYKDGPENPWMEPVENQGN